MNKEAGADAKTGSRTVEPAAAGCVADDQHGVNSRRDSQQGDGDQVRGERGYFHILVK